MGVDVKDRSSVIDDESDDDEFAPEIDEARMLVDLLLAANPRQRLRGVNGEAIRELKEIGATPSEWEKFTPEDKEATCRPAVGTERNLRSGALRRAPEKAVEGR